MPRFTEPELHIMRILWEHGEMKPAEIQDKFPREIKNAATRSFLRVLLAKGHVTRRKVGKAYYYKARTPQESAFRSMLRQMVDAFCGGSTDALFVKLVRDKKMSQDDLSRIKSLADEISSKAKKAKPR